ncbi:MAG: hypothetical protein ACTS27_02170 [Phycisphaerales bacterium]
MNHTSKRFPICVFVATLLAAAGGCSTMSIERLTDGEGNTSLHAVSLTPETHFGFVTRDVLHRGRAEGTASVADEFAAVASGESTTQIVTKQLSETFDQPTTQSLAQFHAAYLGLIADVTNAKNQERYWTEIKEIREQATDVRKEVLARTEYYLALRAISSVERLREERDYLVRRIDALQRDSAIMSDLLNRDIQRTTAKKSQDQPGLLPAIFTLLFQPPAADQSTTTTRMADGTMPGNESSPQVATAIPAYLVSPVEGMTVEEAFESPAPMPSRYTADEVSENGMAYQWRLAQMSPEYRGPWLYRDASWRRAQFRTVSSDLLAKQRALSEVLERLCRAYEREDLLTDHILAILDHKAGTRNPADPQARSESLHINCDRCIYLEDVAAEKTRAAQPASAPGVSGPGE